MSKVFCNVLLGYFAYPKYFFFKYTYFPDEKKMCMYFDVARVKLMHKTFLIKKKNGVIHDIILKFNIKLLKNTLILSRIK